MDENKATQLEVTQKGHELPANWKQRILIIWSGQTFSILSTFAASFAAMWYITETESSAFFLAMAGVAFLLPIGILSPFGGVAADRLNKKHLMMLADATVGVLTAVMALLVIRGSINTVLIIILMAIRGCAQAFHAPALMALAPQLVPERHLVRINTFDQLLSSGAAIIGPVLGILLYTSIGFEAVLLADSVCAGIACFCLGITKIENLNALSQEHKGVFEDLQEGVRFLAADKPLLGLMAICMSAVAIFTPLGSLYPLMTFETFLGNAYQASLVEAVTGIGLLVGSVILLVWGGGKKLVPVIMTAGFAIGAFLICCGFLGQDQFVFFVILVGLVAMAMAVFNGPILPILQKRASEEMTGRIMGLFLTGSTLATPVGLFITGFGAEFFGMSAWYIICGGLLCLIMLFASTRKSIKKLD